MTKGNACPYRCVNIYYTIYLFNATLGVTTSLDDFANATATQRGLKNFFWPGRYQIIQSHDSTFYLDGAHTLESIKVCINWFKEETKYSTKRKILIFNTTGDRDAALLLNLLHACNFSMTYFVPNVAGQTVTAGMLLYN